MKPEFGTPIEDAFRRDLTINRYNLLISKWMLATKYKRTKHILGATLKSLFLRIYLKCVSPEPGKFMLYLVMDHESSTF